MRIVVLVVFCINLLFGDIVQIYRTKGLEAVGEYLDNRLKDRDFWELSLSDKGVQYGYYEAMNLVLHAQKSKKELRIYELKNDSFENIFTTSVLIGKGNGDKQTQGDLKTPVGAYDFVERKTNVDSFYGPLALVTSYPNLYDKLLGKNGSGIWIHGTPQNEIRDDFTRGCLALQNDILLQLDNLLKNKKSILLISENNHIQTNKTEISIILSQFFKWKDAWSKSNLEEYLSFYDASFKRADGMNIDEFKKYKTAVFSKKEEKKIVFNSINIIPYPNIGENKMFKIIFDEDYRTKNYKYVGPKELFIKLIEDKIYILAEG